jgi:CDP-diacylglycerol--glycerol-3-phosphate 3-phosphatidyltransferase
VNLPNKLTVSRMVLTVLFLAVMFTGFRGYESVAVALMWLAAITDYLDGSIARRRGLITNFGVLMDPLADKILTCSAFIAFIEPRLIEPWVVIIIVARELAITGLRLLAASQNVILAAERFGKHKTAWQLTTIISILTMLGYTQWGVVGEFIFGWHLFGVPWIVRFAELSKWITVALTLVSGSVYLWRNRALYLQDM